MPQSFIVPLNKIISEERYTRNGKEYVKARYIFDFYGGPFEETEDYPLERWEEFKKAGTIKIWGF